MTTTPDNSLPDPTAVAEAYFDAWSRNDPAALADVLADDVIVHGPLGRIDGAAAYQPSLGRIFSITHALAIQHRWVDGGDVLTWFDLHPHGDHEPFPVASWLHIENNRIAQVRVTFDLNKLFKVGDPRRHADRSTR